MHNKSPSSSIKIDGFIKPVPAVRLLSIINGESFPPDAEAL
jgi:hypothetical protein